MREINLQTAVNEIVASTLRRREKGEDFPFFFIVGAGISYPPIPLAAGIEERCRERLSADGSDVPVFNKESALDRYQTLFERAYPQAEDRQDFLHDLIHRKPISAANFRLAHLLGELKLTNLVFTTNFDEMLSRALRLLGYDVVVCDHPKTTARIRSAQKNAQVIHVHGTHWFYDCCNLKGEIEDQARLDPGDSLSMGQLLDRVLADRSPIVIGYSGWEGDVVMSAIRRRLSQLTLPRNLYWFCYRRQDAEALPSWLKDHKNVRFVFPPLPLKEERRVTSKEKERSDGTGDLQVDEDFEREPVLPAQVILEAMIQALKLGAPLLTQDPMKFFLDQLSKSIFLEEGNGEDLYLLQQVIDRVQRSTLREKEGRSTSTQRERVDADALFHVSDAVRRLAYKEALDIVHRIDHSALTAEQRSYLNGILIQIAQALISKGIDLGQARRLNEALSVLDEVAERLKDSPEPSVREQVAQALYNKGIILGQVGLFREAIKVYEEYFDRFGTDASLNLQTARVLVNKGAALGEMGLTGGAVLALDEVIGRFGDASEPTLSAQVAKALFNKGVILGQAGQIDKELAAYDGMLARFRDNSDPALRRQSGMALLNKGLALEKIGRIADAIATYEEVIARYSDAPEPALRESVAKAFINKGDALGELGKLGEQIAAYDEVISRFGTSSESVLREWGTEPQLRQLAAQAFLKKGAPLLLLGRLDEAVVVSEEVVARFAGFTEPALRKAVAQALGYKGVAFWLLGRSDEAVVSVYEELVARFANSTEPALRKTVAKTLDNLSMALLDIQRWPEALEAAQRAVSFGAERYNLACALSRVGNSDEALSELEGCLSRGEISRDYVLEDPDWEALREDPRFQELTKEPEGA